MRATQSDRTSLPYRPAQRKPPVSEPISLGSTSQPKDVRSMRRRERRDLAQLNVSLPRDLVDSLKDKAHSDRRAIADIIEQLVYGYVNAAPTAPPEPIEPRLVSMMIDDAASNGTHSIISRQYRELAGMTYSAADRLAVDAFVAEHGAPSEAHVRAGIAATLIRTKQRRIHSVSYYLPEILRAMDAGADAGYAEHCVRRLQRERQLRADSR